MTPCHVVEITTPKRVVLDGLWLGKPSAKTAVILIHGLAGSFWRRLPLAYPLIDRRTAVLAFNNRGHDRISRIIRSGEKKAGKSRWGGGASEVFEECVDDIQGAISFARKRGAKRIYLVGHSTGCQKSVYWAYKKKGKGIKGMILLAGLSDYSVALRDDKNGRLARATKYARALVRRGKKHELLPQSLWPAIDDAQRFLSLYTPDSAEEMFTYAQRKVPRIFHSVKVPILAVFAGADEFGDRPAQEIAAWYAKNARTKTYKSVIVPGARHGFKGFERRIAREIRRFIKG
ncbi:hypothetical protein A2853_02180 [Candidatus Kaiserbacteria bacterium RIFCSPHIGHO2_01_FULL_55_17]|uniref:Serine aminopeptidase S33 domain-containing protein n=1 Tax=Candidatus Kaiserbacteria bacterium RIFCSPHIGHO2_01_FULL_55_17 TaxID=1798484 RepID=A0A1F6D7E4_9BACT|nr:MAG: hypothetical protein A2853_02180 [Candidatus Kaiserbacteria bacterium RIFCSPHIGHO2_01_FULL_55_17]